MAKGKRNYGVEYARDQASPAQIAARASRNKARAAVEKQQGPLPKNKEIDHVDGNPMNNSSKNLKVVSRTVNRKKR